MPAPVVHFEVMGRDFERMRSFYGDLFEWDLKTPGPAPYAVTGAPGGQGIGGGVGASDDPSGAMFYVQVPDLEAALKKAEELGGKRALEPMKVNETIDIAHFEDPEGNRIGLVKGDG